MLAKEMYNCISRMLEGTRRIYDNLGDGPDFDAQAGYIQAQAERVYNSAAQLRALADQNVNRLALRVIASETPGEIGGFD